jgi:hypothetical protein
VKRLHMGYRAGLFLEFPAARCHYILPWEVESSEASAYFRNSRRRLLFSNNKKAPGALYAAWGLGVSFVVQISAYQQRLPVELEF